ncbi:hypothetical protein KGQ34_03735 [Patescibacteria group bacterium]|nr:hypothetical protein [Patescibacteria group bacterium]
MHEGNTKKPYQVQLFRICTRDWYKYDEYETDQEAIAVAKTICRDPIYEKEGDVSKVSVVGLGGEVIFECEPEYRCKLRIKELEFRKKLKK